MPEASRGLDVVEPKSTFDESHVRHAETRVWHDAVSGFVGGAAGILAANVFDLLKVREQVASTHGPVPAPSSKAIHPKHRGIQSLEKEGILRGLHTLYKKEGWRVFFAGTLGPVAMYAPLDAIFFSIWGQGMDRQHQDRDDPHSLVASGIAGGAAGAICALAQTPVRTFCFVAITSLKSAQIEVVKVRAQMERQTQAIGQKRKGTLGIAADMRRKEGFRGFFVGFMPTLVRDTLANGIFFPTYHACRRLCRGEHPFLTRQEALDRRARGVPSIFRIAALDEADRIDVAEFFRISLASGIAGVACMVATYPLDVIKTQAQQSVKANVAGERIDVSMRALTARIWEQGRFADAQRAHRSRLSRTFARARGFSRGIRLGVATAALQSAIILPIFELGVSWLRS